VWPTSPREPAAELVVQRPRVALSLAAPAVGLNDLSGQRELVFGVVNEQVLCK
jgi:hypothetical protein